MKYIVESGSLDSTRHLDTKARGANGIRYPGSPDSKRCTFGVGGFDPFCAGANALNVPPGEYGRKIKTERNLRGPAQAVEYVAQFDATRRALPVIDISL